jgi:hypothetical protein
VGNLVGLDVGTFVGAPVGSRVGAEVGALVGLAVARARCSLSIRSRCPANGSLFPSSAPTPGRSSPVFPSWLFSPAALSLYDVSLTDAVTRRDHSHSVHDDSVGSDPESTVDWSRFVAPASFPSPLDPAPDNPSRLMVSTLCWFSPSAQEIARIPHRTARVLTRVDIIVAVMVSCERRTAYAQKVSRQRVFISPNALLLEGHMTVVVPCPLDGANLEMSHSWKFYLRHAPISIIDRPP